MNNEIELRGRMAALEAQRDRALTDHAIESGARAFLQARVTELEAQLAEATKPKQEA